MPSYNINGKNKQTKKLRSDYYYYYPSWNFYDTPNIEMFFFYCKPKKKKSSPTHTHTGILLFRKHGFF